VGTKSQTFTASGTFTAPANVTLVWVTGTGGGGGGGAGSQAGVNKQGGGGGASGEFCLRTPLHVAGTVAVTIGVGGLGSSSAISGGSKGGTTYIGRISLDGGGAGNSAEMLNQDQSTRGGGVGSVNVGINTANIDGVAGFRESSSFWAGSNGGGITSNAFPLGRTGGPFGGSVPGALGGARTTPFDFYAGGAGGGSSFFAVGGKGGDAFHNGNNCDPNAYGAGGGGAGTCTSAPQTLGGRGQDGVAILEWVE